MTAGDKQYEINRNDSIQTEFEKETGNLATFNIKWNDDCSYTLTLVGDNFGLKDQAGDNTTLNFDIIEATKSYYIFRQEFSFMDAGNIDTIWRARN